MALACTGIASAGLNGLACPSPSMSRPADRHVAGMNCAMPIAPTGLTARGLKLLSAANWAASNGAVMPGHDGLLTTEKHKDLIKKAVELADLPEAQAYHRAFTAWTSIEAQRNIDVKAARTKMEGLMSEYAHSVSKRNGL